MSSAIAEAFRQQYRAALAMHEECIRRCPDEHWNAAEDGNRFWHLSYHTLFFVAFYLSSNDAPVLWPGARPLHHVFTGGPWAPDFDPTTLKAYTRDELLEFVQWLRVRFEECFNDADTNAPSQFTWLPFSRFEVYLYNLRHFQHHSGQLSERIKNYSGEGVKWVGKA